MFETYSPHSWKTQDPDWRFPDRKGLMLSDQIRRFCAKKLLISEGYCEDSLRPAAYTLTIGDIYYDSSGERKELSEKEPYFEMPPNSIVFVSIAESLDLPVYIAARFNLRVDWVYKGILLGTGPQVEPGFRGKLSCPLYNLTNQRHRIGRGDAFASIDFERTTNFVQDSPRQVFGNLEQRDKLFAYETDQGRFLLFTQREFKPLEKYPSQPVISSLVQMQRELAMWRKLGIAIVVSFFALTLTLLNFHNNLLRETISNAKDVSSVRERADSTTKQVSELKDHLNAVQQEVETLRKRPPNPPK